MPSPETQFNGVSVLTKANVYFGGDVVSHTVLSPDGAKRTLGIIRPGSYHFNTDAAELMEIVDGTCNVTINGTGTTRAFQAGTHFTVPAKSGFEIQVAAGLCQYICSFIS